jgi:thiol-disulfide isomerase/thioredoxin
MLSMKTKNNIIYSLTILLSLFGQNAVSQEDHPEPKTLEIGSQAPAFSLPGVDDKMHSLADYKKAKVLVVIFSCNHCPTAQAYEDRIISIHNDYADKGVSLIVISSNSMKSLNYWEQGWSDLDDSFDEMKVRARDKNFTFPYLYDGDDQKVGIAYGPMATPHSFVFDKLRKLQYVGRIDASPTNGKGEDLRNAIDAVLSGQKIEKPVTKVFGCSMKWYWKTEGTKKLYKEWSELPVTIEDIDTTGIRELVRNKSDKLRLINVWASWCGPCVVEFPDLVVIDRIYRSRQFEFVSLNVDKPSKKEDVLKFLKKHEASNKNYMFKSDNIYDLIEAIDPAWQGALPYSLLIEPGGNIIYRIQGSLNTMKVRKLIVGNKFIGG